MEILLVTMDWTCVGGGESCMQIVSTRGGVVGPPEGEGESGRHIVSTHGEENIWRRTGFLQVWGTVHNKSSYENQIIQKHVVPPSGFIGPHCVSCQILTID